jgi:hypothetical protein
LIQGTAAIGPSLRTAASLILSLMFATLAAWVGQFSLLLGLDAGGVDHHDMVNARSDQ